MFIVPVYFTFSFVHYRGFSKLPRVMCTTTFTTSLPSAVVVPSTESRDQAFSPALECVRLPSTAVSYLGIASLLRSTTSSDIVDRIVVFIILTNFVLSSTFFRRVAILLSKRWEAGTYTRIIKKMSSTFFTPVDAGNVAGRATDRVVFFVEAPPTWVCTRKYYGVAGRPSVSSYIVSRGSSTSSLLSFLGAPFAFLEASKVVLADLSTMPSSLSARADLASP